MPNNLSSMVEKVEIKKGNETKAPMCIKRAMKEWHNTCRILLSTTRSLEDTMFEKSLQVLGTNTTRIFGYIRILSYVALFTYFFIFNFGLFSNQQFISNDATSGNCKHVPKSWTVSALNADYLGHWEGHSKYQLQYNSYHFSLLNFISPSLSSYSRWMLNINDVLRELGAQSARNNLVVNLLIWSSWSRQFPTLDFEGKSVPQTVSLTGDAGVIMDNEVIKATVASEKGDCNFNMTAVAYDKESGEFSLRMPFLSAFMTDPVCNVVAPTIDWRVTKSNEASLTVNVYSLFAAMSVVYNVNGNVTLQQYSKLRNVARGSFHGVDYTAVEVFDANHAKMSPITCIGPSNADSSDYICLLKVGPAYGIPFLTHRGANKTSPIPCECSTYTGMSSLCDDIDLLAGIMVHDISKNLSAVAGYDHEFKPFIPILEIFFHSKSPVATSDRRKFNELLFYPAYTAIFGQNRRNQNNQFEKSFNPTSVQRYAYYSFSHTSSFGTGALIVFSTTSLGTASYINKNHYALSNGACFDAIYSPNFKSLVDYPWGELVEPYYHCTMLLPYAIINALGLSAAISWLGTPLVLVALIQFFLCICASDAHRTVDDRVDDCDDDSDVNNQQAHQSNKRNTVNQKGNDDDTRLNGDIESMHLHSNVNKVRREQVRPATATAAATTSTPVTQKVRPATASTTPPIDHYNQDKYNLDDPIMQSHASVSRPSSSPDKKKTRKVVIHCMRGKDLCLGQDQTFTANPFLCVKFPGGTEACTSTKIGGGKNPIWNEEITMLVPNKVNLAVIDIVVKSKSLNKNEADKFLGACSISLSKVMVDGKFVGDTDLHDANGHVVGRLEVSVSILK